MKCLFEVGDPSEHHGLFVRVAGVSSDLGSQTMGLVRTCAHSRQISATRVAKLKSHRHCGPGHEKIKLANPILASSE